MSTLIASVSDRTRTGKDRSDRKDYLRGVSPSVFVIMCQNDYLIRDIVLFKVKHIGFTKPAIIRHRILKVYDFTCGEIVPVLYVVKRQYEKYAFPVLDAY